MYVNNSLLVVANIHLDKNSLHMWKGMNFDPEKFWSTVSQFPSVVQYVY